jgi:hypothetical protein
LAASAYGALSAGGTHKHGAIGGEQQDALLQTWGRALDSAAAGSKDTPITRVVNLLKEMQATLQKEAEEDESLYDKLACWCNNNRYEKDQAITAATAKIAELESTIKEVTAKSAELAEKIKELDADVAADKAALAEATKLREKQAKEFHSAEVESIQGIENLKAAIMVLERHHGGAFPQMQLSLLSVNSHAKDIPWGEDHESSLERSFGSFMRSSGLADSPPLSSDSADASSSDARFLQKQDQSTAAATEGWSAADTMIVKRALKSASAFVQSKHGGEYYPSYSAQSGEILGVLKQLKDEMGASLSASQKEEAEAAATFNEMRNAKTAEIENNEQMAERKEDELADAKNALAEAKEDLDQTNAALTADQKFMINLQSTCKDADANFEKRKKERLDEIKVVSETIEILTADEAKDTFSSTYNFVQTSQHRTDVRRERAAALLRQAAARGHSPELSVLATSVELDAFTRVKKAIDDMIAQLKAQQADEVKKSDWCTSEIQSNEMSTMKATSMKSDLEVKVSDLSSTMDKLSDEITVAKKDIAQLQLELQRASENRKQANMDFQKTVAEQRATQEILATALDKLAKFYDASFTQVGSKRQVSAQTPPVAQMKYEKSSASSGVMSMIEKLIYEAKGLEKDSIKGELEAQRQYEALVADTNGSVAALSKLITTKTGERAQTKKEKLETESDLKDTENDLEGLGKYNADLHGECDYILKNFGIRQEARGQEIEALQQAKQILSGAMSK